MSARSRSVALVLALVLALGAATHLIVDRVTGLPDDAVLRVGDVTVDEDDFRSRLAVITALYGVRPPPPGPELDRFERDAAQAVAASIVIDQAAAERGVVVPEPVARDTLEAIIEENFAPEGRPAFARALGTLRLSEADVLAEVRRQLTTSRLLEQVTADAAPVTDADVATAYEQRRDQLVIPEQRRLLNIVTDSPERAEQAAVALRGGAPFAPLAASTSLDRSTAGTGGDLGLLAADQLEAPIADAAFAVGPGAVFGPVTGGRLPMPIRSMSLRPAGILPALVAVALLAATVLLVLGVVTSTPTLSTIALVLAVVAAGLVLVGGRGSAPRSPATAPASAPATAPATEPAAATVPAPKTELATEPATTTEPAEPAPAPGPELVLVVAGRGRFHRPGCELVAAVSVARIAIDEARDEGFTPCTRCHA